MHALTGVRNAFRVRFASVSYQNSAPAAAEILAGFPQFSRLWGNAVLSVNASRLIFLKYNSELIKDN